MVGYGPVFLCVIYKEGLYPSSRDINSLMMIPNLIRWRLAGLVVWNPDYEIRGPGFKSRLVRDHNMLFSESIWPYGWMKTDVHKLYWYGAGIVCSCNWNIVCAALPYWGMGKTEVWEKAWVLSVWRYLYLGIDLSLPYKKVCHSHCN
jgi:hypothetical protein